MAARAKAMRADGVDVLSFSAGEPDFDTPTNIKDAAIAALDRGDTKYTPVPGTPALRKAVAAWTNARYPVDMTPDNVVVGCGAKQVVFNAAAALLEPGDEAILYSP
ncbi:MAG: aminotransferase class I/II-fold pyridoxal phosphate-dependent enzyme, partial [Myxococcota bacterium]